MDGNFYDQQMITLTCLYDLVPVGGFVIFDDIMGIPGILAAWHDFQRLYGYDPHKNPLELVIPIDDVGGYFRKTRKIPFRSDLCYNGTVWEEVVLSTK